MLRPNNSLRWIVLLMFMMLAAFAHAEKKDYRSYDSLLLKLNEFETDSQKVEYVLHKTKKRYHNHLGEGLIKNAMHYKMSSSQRIRCVFQLGDILRTGAKYDDAVRQFYRGLRICQEVNDRASQADFYKELGWTFLMIQELGKAKGFLDSAQTIYDHLGDKIGVASTVSLVATAVYSNDPEESTTYYKQAFLYYEEAGDEVSMLRIGITLATILDELDFGVEAMEYNLRCEQLALKLKDDFALLTTYAALDRDYFKAGNLEKSDQYWSKLNTLNASIAKSEKKAASLAYLARAYLLSGRKDRSLAFYKEALSIAEEEDLLVIKQHAYQALYRINFAENNAEEALRYYQLHIQAKDSMFNIEKTNQIYEMREKFDAEKREEAITSLKKERNFEKKIKNFLTFSVIAVIAALLLMINQFSIKKKSNVLLTRKNEHIEKQAELLSKKNDQITDSITYAKRLQEALLPSPKKLRSLLNEHFVLYLPKSIVSGDFYWGQELEDGKVIFAVADCTGHGVPGAMMSTMGMNLLDRIVNQLGVTSPAKVLAMLSIEIQKKIGFSDDRSIKDGMDIAMVVYDPTEMKMTYSGAYNSIYHVRNGVMEELDATRVPIGQPEAGENGAYVEEVRDMKDGDMIFMYSDGYPDQRGGVKGKKYYYGPFRKLLAQNSDKPVDEQYRLLLVEFGEWKGNHEQIDDICIVGIRV